MGMVVDSYRFAAAGAWSPLDLPSLAGWWDASDADSFTYSSGVVVSQWDDLSGNGYHFTQADTGKQPSRNGTQNSLTTVTFDGTDDRMISSSLAVSQPLSIIYACDLGATDRSVIGSYSTGNLQTYGAASDAQKRMYAGTEQIVSSANPLGVNVWGFLFNGASSKGWKNSTASATLNPGTTGLSAGVVIGTRDPYGTLVPFRTEMFEIIITSNAISDSDYEDARNYLATKWGI